MFNPTSFFMYVHDLSLLFSGCNLFWPLALLVYVPLTSHRTWSEGQGRKHVISYCYFFHKIWMNFVWMADQLSMLDWLSRCLLLKSIYWPVHISFCVVWMLSSGWLPYIFTCFIQASSNFFSISSLSMLHTITAQKDRQENFLWIFSWLTLSY